MFAGVLKWDDLSHEIAAAQRTWLGKGCKVTLIKPLCSPEISALIDCKKNMLTQRKTADKRKWTGQLFSRSVSLFGLSAE